MSCNYFLRLSVLVQVLDLIYYQQYFFCLYYIEHKGSQPKLRSKKNTLTQKSGIALDWMVVIVASSL